MARALECPACGARHRIDNLPDAPTFRCDRCGQVLKVPTPVSSSGSEGPAPVAPPPRRRDGDTATSAAPVRTAAAVSATVAVTGPAAEAGDAEGGRRAHRGAKSTGARQKVSWYWRALAWLVAVPVGFVITAWPAYQLGLIKKDDVLDIFVGTGSGRYVRLAIGTAVWALVTALLVQLFVEGGRVWAARRRARAVPA